MYQLSKLSDVGALVKFSPAKPRFLMFLFTLTIVAFEHGVLEEILFVGNRLRYMHCRKFPNLNVHFVRTTKFYLILAITSGTGFAHMLLTVMTPTTTVFFLCRMACK